MLQTRDLGCYQTEDGLGWVKVSDKVPSSSYVVRRAGARSRSATTGYEKIRPKPEACRAWTFDD